MPRGCLSEIERFAVDRRRYLRISGDRRGCTGVLLLGDDKCLVLPDAPYVFGKVRKIDKRIAVSLILLHIVVAVDLFLAHRILTRPLQQHVGRPGHERGIGVAHKHVVIYPLQIVIDGRHIEYGAGKVPLVFVSRLEHMAVASAISGFWRAYLGHAVVECRGARLAERIVELGLVGGSVARIEVPHVAVGRGLAFDPDLLAEYRRIQSESERRTAGGRKLTGH